MVVLSRTTLKLGTPRPAEHIAVKLEGRFVDLTIGLDDVDIEASRILEESDPLRALIPTSNP